MIGAFGAHPPRPRDRRSLAPDLFTAETPLGTYRGMTDRLSCRARRDSSAPCWFHAARVSPSGSGYEGRKSFRSGNTSRNLAPCATPTLTAAHYVRKFTNHALTHVGSQCLAIVRSSEGDLVPQKHDILALSQFRLRLIEFLKLPLDISESALREELERISPNVLRNYLARAQDEGILESEDTITMRVLGRGGLTIFK